MPELIDRQAALKKMCETCGYCERFEKAMRSTHPDFVTDKCNNYKFLAEQPTIELEVRHGRWRFEKGDNKTTRDGWICTACNYGFHTKVPYFEAFNFCPMCGAKMDADMRNEL